MSRRGTEALAPSLDGSQPNCGPIVFFPYSNRRLKMIRKIIEATFLSAASITFRISSGRARSVECGARTTPAVLLLEGDVVLIGNPIQLPSELDSGHAFPLSELP